MTPSVRQASLFGFEPSRPSVAPWQRVPLDPTSWVAVARGWLAGADGLLEELLPLLPLRQGRRVLFDGWVDEPRLSCGLLLGSRSPAVVADIATALGAEFGVHFASCFVNHYRDGNDSVAWHRDRDHLVRPNPTVAIVSLGGPRRFHLRPHGGGPSVRLVLGSGDALVMGGATQHRWEHAVPKMAGAFARMSLSFREREPEVDLATDEAVRPADATG